MKSTRTNTTKTYSLDSMNVKLFNALIGRRDCTDELQRRYWDGQIDFIANLVGADITGPWFDQFAAETKAADTAAVKAMA